MPPSPSCQALQAVFFGITQGNQCSCGKNLYKRRASHPVRTPLLICTPLNPSSQVQPCPCHRPQQSSTAARVVAESPSELMPKAGCGAPCAGGHRGWWTATGASKCGGEEATSVYWVETGVPSAVRDLFVNGVSSSEATSLIAVKCYSLRTGEFRRLCAPTLSLKFPTVLCRRSCVGQGWRFKGESFAATVLKLQVQSQRSS